MNIIEALKDENENLRISNGSRWLYWDTVLELWTVQERKPYAKRTTILYHGVDEQAAVAFFLGKEGGAE